jgi:glycosyltransferase involved in cell wall biosynthesis
MSKRILLISAVFPPEPVVSATLAMDLYRALRSDGHHVQVLCPRPSRPMGFKFSGDAIAEVNVRHLPSYLAPGSNPLKRLWESISFGWHCYRFIKAAGAQYDLVYVNSWPLFSQAFIIKACVQGGMPCVVHVQDMYPESLANKLTPWLGRLASMLLMPIDRYVLSRAKRIIVISAKMKEHLRETRHLPEERFVTVINWQDERPFILYQSADNALPKEEKMTFMYCGNVGPVAGIDVLIDGFAEAGIAQARLVIAGSGSYRDAYVAHARKYPASDIQFWEVPAGKVPEIQSRADVMLLPLRKGAASSSIPSKLPAYMFSAKAVLAALDADSDTAEAIRAADCGIICEPESPKAIADAMRYLAQAPQEQVQNWGQHGQEYALAHFTRAKNLSKLTKTLLSLDQGKA